MMVARVGRSGRECNHMVYVRAQTCVHVLVAIAVWLGVCMSAWRALWSVIACI
jgi:hypothetical protein